MVQSVRREMLCIIFILCLVQSQVLASEWQNRTVRVEFNVNNKVRAYDPQYDILEGLETPTSISSAVNATNGRYPWTILTIAWGDWQGGFRIGTTCTGTLITNNLFLSDIFCTRYNSDPRGDTMETFIGSAQWGHPLVVTTLVRHYWFIAPSVENSPSIVLARLHETITFNPNIHPIRLPSSGNFDYVGWSSLQLGFESVAGIFFAYSQSAETTILNNNLCNFDPADHEMCGVNGGDTLEFGLVRLNAFIGGALFVSEYSGSQLVPVAVGIHQFQYVNTTGSFSQASRVSRFVEWIDGLSSDQKE